ncbi:MAG: hypothetical protein K8R07_03080, partial [Desulfobacterales bacterium]|nr:hypothetical protein [Desulfobacterales bacterium]
NYIVRSPVEKEFHAYRLLQCLVKGQFELCKCYLYVLISQALYMANITQTFHGHYSFVMFILLIDILLFH